MRPAQAVSHEVFLLTSKLLAPGIWLLIYSRCSVTSPKIGAYMHTVLNRRMFLKGTSALFAASQADFLARLGKASETDTVVAATSSGNVRGVVVDEIKVFKGIPYGGTTAGKN